MNEAPRTVFGAEISFSGITGRNCEARGAMPCTSLYHLNLSATAAEKFDTVGVELEFAGMSLEDAVDAVRAGLRRRSKARARDIAIP